MEQILGPISAVIGTLGILGNCVVCVVIWRIQHMHTVTNALLFNQAVADLLGSLVFLLAFNIPVMERLPPGVSGWLYCYLWKSECLMWMFLFTSIMSLVVVTLERYLAIVYPFKYQALLACRWAPGVAIAMTWVLGIGLGLCLFTLIVYSESDHTCEMLVPPPVEHRLSAVVHATNMVMFVIPAGTMLFAYMHIAVILKRGARQTESFPVSTLPSNLHSDGAESSGPANNHMQETQGDSLLRARRNVIKTLVLVSVAYAICWLPNTIIVAANISGLPYRIATMFSATNSSLNPVIYTIKYKCFRKGLQSLLRTRNSVDTLRMIRVVEPTSGVWRGRDSPPNPQNLSVAMNDQLS